MTLYQLQNLTLDGNTITAYGEIKQMGKETVPVCTKMRRSAGMSEEHHEK
jgi:hypothetical protein